MTMPTRQSLLTAGVAESAVDSVLQGIRDAVPVELKIYWMYDCHAFEKLGAATLDEIIAEASEIQKEDGYGMLCSPILLAASGKEVRRPGVNAHGRGKNLEYWQDQCAKWKAACEADADLMRLLALRTPLAMLPHDPTEAK